MAQQKIQSVQLSDSGVVPGPYTSADVTVDAAGRITAISNGAGGGGTVTSVSVDGTVGRVTSSGSPVTGSGSITLDLATTAVTPGAYTSANISVDAYGRITSAANGASVPTLTATEVAYGSPGNTITSTADFTYDDGTGTLEVGPTGFNALIEANTGQSITVSGDTGAALKSGLNTFGINSTGAVLVNASAGTAGQVLTSAGSGLPPTWSPSSATSAPLNELVYGTGPGVTSDPDLTFNSATDTLVVGAATNGAITAATGFSITLESDGGTKSLTLESTGDISITGNPGTVGQVITSAGPGAPAVWSTPAGGAGLEMNVFVMTGGSGSFDGSLVNNYTSANQRDESPTLLWDPDTYGGNYTCLVNGVYEIVVECKITGDNGSNLWPAEMSSYGVDLYADYPASNTTPQTKLHVRYSPSDFLGGNGGLQVGPSAPVNEAGNTSSFTERFIVRSDVGGIVYPKMFAYSYSSSGSSAGFSMSISFMKISDYTPA